MRDEHEEYGVNNKKIKKETLSGGFLGYGKKKLTGKKYKQPQATAKEIITLPQNFTKNT